MYLSTAWLRSLAEVNKRLASLEDPATSVRLLSDFSTPKICAVLQGRASQLGSVASTGCTIPLGSALSLPLPPHPQGPGSHTPLATGFCLVAPPVHTFKSGWAGYIHIQELPSLHSMEAKYILSEGKAPFADPLVQLLQSFWSCTFSKALACFLLESPFPS